MNVEKRMKTIEEKIKKLDNIMPILSEFYLEDEHIKNYKYIKEELYNLKKKLENTGR
jgi:hypothetical protein